MKNVAITLTSLLLTAISVFGTSMVVEPIIEQIAPATKFPYPYNEQVYTIPVTLKLDRNGEVVEVEVQDGPEILRYAVVDTVFNSLSFTPVIVNGEPVEATVKVPLVFNPYK